MTKSMNKFVSGRYVPRSRKLDPMVRTAPRWRLNALINAAMTAKLKPDQK